MPEYLVEVYVPRSGVVAVREAAVRARASAEQLSGQGVSVRYVRAIFVPEDETCFHVFEASTTEAVRAASERAAFPARRIVQSVGMQPITENEPEGRTRSPPSMPSPPWRCPAAPVAACGEVPKEHRADLGAP